MGLVHETPAPIAAHVCKLPGGGEAQHWTRAKRGEGSLWRCAECGTTYVLRYPPYYNNEYLRWKRMTRLRAWWKLFRLGNPDPQPVDEPPHRGGVSA